MPKNVMSEDEKAIEDVKRVLARYKKKDWPYFAVPLADFYEEPKRMEWLRTHGLEIPLERPSGRNPTPQELRYFLKGEDFYVSYSIKLDGQWIATARQKSKVTQEDNRRTARMIQVCGRDYSHEDKPITLEFGGSYDLIKFLLEQLVALCGPFVLMMEGGNPEVIIGRSTLTHGN